MYSNLHYGLDTPPPPSRFRRPWSPDPHDPLPSASRPTNDDYFSSPHPLQRREPSDVSVEALDLADYAATLNRNNHTNMYDRPAYNFHAYDAYPPSPPAGLLRSPQSAYTPSLASPSSTSANSHSAPTSRRPLRRPFSLPPPSNYPQYQQPTTVPSFSDASHRMHDRPSPRAAAQDDDEIDIGRFPTFAQGWYDSKSGAGKILPPPSPVLSASAEQMSPFDPTYRAHTFASPYSHSPPPSYPHDLSAQLHSSHDHGHLPWSADADGAPLDPELKEERMRMLEREFAGPQEDSVEPNLVGSVDEKGRLITQGPKKRLAVRCVEALFALTAAVASIYAALIIKPATTPPPSGKLPLYILYVLSVLSFLATTYLFLIYPCCCGARPKAAKDGMFQGPNGLMVLPVQSFPGGAKAKKKRGKKGQGPQDSVQVNLIVDPGLFGGRERDREEDWDDGEGTVPGSFDGSVSGSGTRSGRTGRRPKRRGVFEGLAMEAQWKRARKMLKWGTAFDALSLVLWGMEFVLIMMGPRCPSSEFDGWCESYNLATAVACLLALAFGCSIFFDIKDLHASKDSPRTRT